MSHIIYLSLLWRVFDTSFPTTYNFSSSLPRVQRGVSMETRKRQRSVPEPKVHPVGEGGSAKILQQAGCKQLIWNCVYGGKGQPYSGIWESTICCLCLPPSRPGIPRRWWKLRPSMPPSNRPRSATPAACRSPTWKTTAQGTSSSTTVMLRYSITLILTLLNSSFSLIVFNNAVSCFSYAPYQVLDYSNTGH